jgi:hypothetical protein
VTLSIVPRLKRLARLSRRPARPRSIDPALAEAVPARDVSGWWGRRSQALYPRPAASAIRRFREHFAAASEATLRRGRDLLEHRFDLLGSGSVVVSDPERPVGPNGYRPIDWHLDPRTSSRFPTRVETRQWTSACAPAGSDVKWPWEIGRCQHWPVLAQCHLLSGEPRFAREIVDQLRDFAEAAPPGRGVQWVCAMDVAIRAVNWALALEWIRDAVAPEDPFWSQALELLYAHGHFVADHLENGFEVTSNHYLSDLAGLLVLGRFFSGLRQAREWESFARRELEREIRVQLLADGADYESSIPYHRLVSEILLSSLRVMELGGSPPSARFRGDTRAAIEFLESVLRPDGMLPIVGDADDGRLHVLEGYGGPPSAGRHLLGPAAFLLREPRWLESGGEEGRREAFWWGYPEALDAVAPAAPAGPVARLFPEAGIAVFREGGDYLLVSNGRVGTAGFGNHKHNDQLSFELHLDGLPIVVDPGSYVYTSDPAARNQFRSTGIHSTVVVDEAEQNEVNPAWLFRLTERARPEHLFWEVRDEAVEYAGRHNGFAPVVHERRLSLGRRTGTLHVEDRLRGHGRRRLRWHLHFAPTVGLSSGGGGTLLLEVADRHYRLHPDPRWSPRLGQSWYSPSYGVRIPCGVVDFEETVDLGGEITRSFAILPAGRGQS